MMSIFNLDNLVFLLNGLLVTIYIAVISIVLSTIGGIIIGIMKHSKHKVLSKLAAIYIECIRNIPLLLFILVFRFMTPLEPKMAGIAAISLFTSSIIAEIIRGGLNSIPKSQWEAAKSQGFNNFQTLRYIIMPQAFRSVTPPMISQYITIIKDTSFVWMVNIEELTGRGIILMQKANTVQVFIIFLIIAGFYFGMNFPLSIYMRSRQKKLRW